MGRPFSAVESFSIRLPLEEKLARTDAVGEQLMKWFMIALNNDLTHQCFTPHPPVVLRRRSPFPSRGRLSACVILLGIIDGREPICYTIHEVILMTEKRYVSAIVDAFTNEAYSGNQAGVVYLGGDPFPAEERCIKLAAELRFSETAFIRRISQTEYAARYFTPVCEAALCGHATVAAFGFLHEKRSIGLGDMLAHTASGDIRVTVESGSVWLDMAEAKTLAELDKNTCRELYRAYGLRERESVNGLAPAVVSVGLADIMLPVDSLNELNSAVQDEEAVSEISRRLNVTGVHMFYISGDGYAAHCRNFAPLYGIPEECATGTSNGALFKYLSENVIIPSPARFIQGEKMGRPSVITARLENGKVRVGGPGAVVMEGTTRV